MAFDPDEVAEHLSEVFGDIRLGWQEDGYRFFRANTAPRKHTWAVGRPGLWQRSDRYVTNAVGRIPEPRPIPKALYPFKCKCGRGFWQERDLNRHQRFCKARGSSMP